MKKISLDIIVKIIILLCFVIFYFKIISSNEIIRYVHPRIIPFATLGMIAMFMIAVFLITETLKIKKKRIKLKNYVIFIIPLIMVFVMEGTNASSLAIVDDISVNFNGTQNFNFGYANSSSEKTSSDSENDNLYIKDNIIQIDADNFLSSVDTLIGNADKYKGQEIEMTGFVYRDETLKSNEFVIGRFVMACCAADLQVVGIRCDNNNQENYPTNTWVKIKGKLNTETVNYEVEPVILIEQIEQDPNPKTEYLYPF